MTRCHPRATLFFALIGLLMVAVSSSAQKSGVTITSVSKVMVAKDAPALLISYAYDFGGRDTVYIKGVGSMPARGEFEYLTRERNLEVRDRPGGAVLANVPLQETVVVAAKAPLDYVPPEEQFPAPFRSEIWRTTAPLQDRLNNVLRKYFSYMPHEEHEVTYTITTFTPLQVEQLPAGTIAQIALLISYPYDRAGSQYSFHVRSLVHEGRALSDETRPTSNPQIRRAADRFVDVLIDEIKSATPPRP